MTMMALLLTAALGVIVYQHRDQGDVKKLAKEIFYQTKSLELELSRLKLELSKRPEAKVPAKVMETTQRLSDMQQRYARFAEERKLLGSHRSKEDLLIFRVARIFGEYDLSIPDDFVSEVKRYIRKWQHLKEIKSLYKLSNAIETGLSYLKGKEFPMSDHFIGRNISCLIKLSWTENEVKERAEKMKACIKSILA